MLNPITTPTFDSEAALAAFESMFAPRPYDLVEALAKAQALLPDNLKTDRYWLPLMLIVTGGKLEWVLSHINITAEKINPTAIQERFDLLSNSEWFLLVLALHLFNEIHPLPQDGLLNLRLLDDYHLELAMHAIRIHARGVR